MRIKNVAFLVCLSLLGCGGVSDGGEPASLPSPVINGVKSKHSDFPSIVGLTLKKPGLAFCTGTLVAADAVITAAHCVEGVTKVYVAYGLDYPSDESPESAFYESSTVVAHKDFNPYMDSHWNDVGLVVLKKPIPLPTCAPILDEYSQREELMVGNVVTIAGYGRHDMDEYGGELYAGDVPVTAQAETEVTTGEDVMGDPSTGVVGACFGDSGGPIYVEHDGKVNVAGITSRDASGTGACLRGAVYTMPGSYVDWFEAEYGRALCVKNSGIDKCLGSDVKSVKIDESRCQPLKPPPPPVVKPDGGCNVGAASTPHSPVMLVLSTLVLACFFWRKQR